MVQASQPDTDSSTPIPWTTGGCVIYGGDGESVADLVAGICNHNGLTPDQTEANAAFIVRAANNFHLMLAALEAWSRHFKAYPPDDELPLSPISESDKLKVLMTQTDEVLEELQ